MAPLGRRIALATFALAWCCVVGPAGLAQTPSIVTTYMISKTLRQLHADRHSRSGSDEELFAYALKVNEELCTELKQDPKAFDSCKSEKSHYAVRYVGSSSSIWSCQETATSSKYVSTKDMEMHILFKPTVIDLANLSLVKQAGLKPGESDWDYVDEGWARAVYAFKSRSGQAAFRVTRGEKFAHEAGKMYAHHAALVGPKHLEFFQFSLRSDSVSYSVYVKSGKMIKSVALSLSGLKTALDLCDINP